MLRPPLQRLKNEHVECSLQQLNPVLILVFFAHRCRHSTPNGGRSSTSFCIAQRANLPTFCLESGGEGSLVGPYWPISRGNLIKTKKRRGGDSFCLCFCGMCKLQKPRCRICHKCHHSREALP